MDKKLKATNAQVQRQLERKSEELMSKSKKEGAQTTLIEAGNAAIQNVCAAKKCQTQTAVKVVVKRPREMVHTNDIAKVCEPHGKRTNVLEFVRNEQHAGVSAGVASSNSCNM